MMNKAKNTDYTDYDQQVKNCPQRGRTVDLLLIHEHTDASTKNLKIDILISQIQNRAG